MDTPLRLPWWRQPRLRAAGIGVAVLALLIAGAAALLGPAQTSVRVAQASVTMAMVEQGTYRDFTPLRSSVVPRDTIYLDALEGGRVERVLVQAGDTVTFGQALLELSNTALELDVLDREGRLVESITQLQSYETQLEQNRVNNLKALAQIDYDITRLTRMLERRNQLVAKSLESKENRDQVQDDLDRALAIRPMQQEGNERQEALRRKQLPQIQLQLDKLQQDLKITHSKLEALTVRAPAAGVLTAMDLKIGETRNRGERLGEITPDTGYKLTAGVDEFYLGRVHVGQVATVEKGERNWPLKVIRVYPQVKNGTFNVDLGFVSDTPQDLLPGQTLQGQLSLGEDSPGLVLQAGAFLDRSGGDWVFVVDAGGHHAQRRHIKVGRRNVEQVEILEGLKAGEQVIVSDYSGWDRLERIDLKD